jgi:hypothetical protein
MPQTIRPILETIFGVAGPQVPKAEMSWYLVRRQGRPFLLLAESFAAAQIGLKLYSAQRWSGKLWRTVIPLLVGSPGARILERVSFSVPKNSPLLRFLRQQTGAEGGGKVLLAGIKFSQAVGGARLVMLACDESGRPATVMKLGLGGAERAAVGREAELLAKLPPQLIGCVQLTGRLDTEAYTVMATDYYPGSSPKDDAGLEKLFHAWLNSSPPTPIEQLPLWQELDAAAPRAEPENWHLIRAQLAGRKIGTTLYHGDFAPWNVRLISSRNLQVFDWERGQLQGIPGWDWFHFIIQTSVLARRFPVEKAAAELQALLHSARFQRYAQAAGIADLGVPLILSYLLHHRWVNQPREGARACGELFDFLMALWLPTPGRRVPASRPPTTQGLWANARHQLKQARAQLSHLFWSPSLNFAPTDSLLAGLRQHLGFLVGIGVAFGVVVATQLRFTTYVIFLPFFMLMAGWVTLRVGRRWGVVVASAAALAGPIVLSITLSDYRDTRTLVWNTAMRFLILQTCVIFVDRLRNQRSWNQAHPVVTPVRRKWSEVWAVFLTGVLMLGLAAGLDFFSAPQFSLLPFYLLPCMLFTLMLNLRWGVSTAGVAALVWVVIQPQPHPEVNQLAVGTLLWNGAMRLAVTIPILVLLDRIRKNDFVLFRSRPAAQPSAKS